MGLIRVLIIAVMATAPVHLDNQRAGNLGDSVDAQQGSWKASERAW
jgi:hypothetical protein